MMLGCAFAAPLVGGRLELLPVLWLSGIASAGALLVLLLSPDAPRLDWLTIAALASAAIACASLIASVSRGVTLTQLVPALGLVVILIALRTGGRGLIWTLGPLAALAASALIVSLYGYWDYIAMARAGQVAWREFSTFYNPNMLAGFLALTIPVTLGLMLIPQRPMLKAGVGMLVVIQCMTFMTTGSRGGFLALGVGVVGLLAVGVVSRVLSARRDLVALIAVGAVALAAIFIMSRPLVTRTAASGSAAEGASSTAFRVQVWRSTIRMILDRPLLGSGLGTYEYAYPRHAIVGPSKMAHEGYLQLAAEMGVLWAPLLLLWAWALARQALRAIRDGSRSGRLIVLGCGGGLLATAAHSLVDFDWYVYAIALTAAVLVAALTGTEDNRDTEGARIANREWIRYLSVVLCVLVIGFAIPFAGAEAAARRAESHLASSRPVEQALDEMRLAIRWNPWSVEYRRDLGRALRWIGAGSGRSELTGEAIEWLRSAADREPTNPVNRIELGRAEEDTGDTRAAKIEYRQAIELAPNAPRPLMALANIDERTGELESAMGCYRSVIGIERGPVGTIVAIGGRVEPDFVEAHLLLGILESRTRSPAAAEKDLVLGMERFVSHQLWMKGLGGQLERQYASGEEDRLYPLAAEACGLLEVLDAPASVAWKTTGSVLGEFAAAEHKAIEGGWRDAEGRFLDLADQVEGLDTSGWPTPARETVLLAGSRALDKVTFARDAQGRSGSERDRLAARAVALADQARR
jgi:putative inorganic carbon (HCO3(-)) transporter